LVVKDKKNGHVTSKIGAKFHKEINNIVDKRLKNGNSKDRVSIEKITNLIVRHKGWNDICLTIVAATEEEVDQYGT